VKRAALVRDLHPLRRQSGTAKMRLGLVEIVLAEDPEADPAADRRTGRALQHQAVMAGLLEPAQIDGVGGALAHHQPDQLAVEL
jgi:hypothetical protein